MNVLAHRALLADHERGRRARVRQALLEELPGFEVVGWYGVIGPAKLPRPLLMKLHGELVKIVNLPDSRQRILADGSEPKTNSPEEFRRFMLADVEKWTKVVKASGAKMN